MRHPHTLTTKLLALFAFISIAAFSTPAQTNQARSLVTAPVNEGQMVTRLGSTHPLARAEFDRGLAPDSLPMDNMMLGLKRASEQDTALATLLREQQDPTSANYHKWITPQEFGAASALRIMTSRPSHPGCSRTISRASKFHHRAPLSISPAPPGKFTTHFAPLSTGM